MKSLLMKLERQSNKMKKRESYVNSKRETSSLTTGAFLRLGRIQHLFTLMQKVAVVTTTQLTFVKLVRALSNQV